MRNISVSAESSILLSDIDIARAQFQDILSEHPDEDSFGLICSLADIEYKNSGILTKHFKMLLQSQTGPHEIKTAAFYFHKLYNGGVERVISLLADLLSREISNKRYKVIIITDDEPSGDDYKIPEDVIHISIPSYYQHDKPYKTRGTALINAIEQYEIDAIVYGAWMNEDMIWDLLTIKTCRKHPAFFIHTHGFCSALWMQQYNIVKFSWDYYSLADGIITLSDSDRMYWGCINKNVYKIYNPRFGNPIKKQNLWKDHPHHILWVGRISAEKQPFEVIKIMQSVAKSMPEIICHIIGSGDAEMTAKLKTAITELSLDNNIRLEGFHKEVDSFYQNADIFLSTSAFEGYGMTLMESASYGIPTVMYDIPWLEYKKIISGYETVPQLDAEKAAEVIVGILQDRENWQQHSDLIFNSYQEFDTLDTRKEWDTVFSNYQDQITAPHMDINKDFSIVLDQMVQFHSAFFNNSFLNEIYSSSTWKIGRFFVKPLYKMKMLFKRIKERLSFSS